MSNTRTRLDCIMGVTAVLATIAMAVPALGQTTWNVNCDCVAPGSGTPEDPFCLIQDGINAALDGDIVEVADCIYAGIGNRDLDFGGKAITVRGVGARDGCIIDCVGSSVDNHRAFYFHSGETADAIVENLHLMNGWAVDGGAIYITGSSPTIRNCKFSHNIAEALADTEFTGMGGAIFVGSDSNPLIQECDFMDNTALSGGVGDTGNGGAIRNLYGNPTVKDCLFLRNAGMQLGAAGGGGGAIASRGNTTGGNLILEDCDFVDNTAGHVGGAVVCRASFSELQVTRCMFVGNHGEVNSGAMWLSNGKWRVANSVFVGNTAGYSAAVLSNIPSPAEDAIFVNCLVAGNSADSGSGGIGHVATLDRELRLANCTIVANEGGAGGLVNNDGVGNSNLTVVNSIVWNNVPDQIVTDPGATTQVTYSTVEGGYPGAGNIADDPSFQGGPSGVWTDMGVYDEDSGQTMFTDADANWASGELAYKLLNPDTSQYLQTWIVSNTQTTVNVWGDFETLGMPLTAYQINDYHASCGSPVIDAADNMAVPPDELDLDNDGDLDEPIPVDLDGNERFVDDPCTENTGLGEPPVDMGTYEYQACPGDVDCDGAVNVIDLLALLGAWGPCPDCAADLDGDGNVNVIDLLALLAGWGSC